MQSMTWFRRSAHLENELSAYVDGELSERARRAVETHLATCEACSVVLQELQDTKSLLSQLPKLEPRRSLALGPEFAIERRVAAPRRTSFTFAPAVALTVLVALLFVDALDSRDGSSQEGASNVADTTAAFDLAQRTEASAGLAAEPTKAGDDERTLGAAESAVQQDGTAGAIDSAACIARDDAPAAAAGGALAQLAQDPTSEPEAAAVSPTEVAPEVATGGASGAAAESTLEAPQELSPLAGPEDSSGGVSTLRMLQVVAALAFVASPLAVFLPRIMGRQER